MIQLFSGSCGTGWLEKRENSRRSPFQRDRDFLMGHLHHLNQPSIFQGRAASFQGGRQNRCGNGKKTSDTNTFHFRCSWYWMIIEQWNHNRIISYYFKNKTPTTQRKCLLSVFLVFVFFGGTKLFKKNHYRRALGIGINSKRHSSFPLRISWRSTWGRGQGQVMDTPAKAILKMFLVAQKTGESWRFFRWN